MDTTAEVTCPKCGGNVWDNRTTKRSPKAPDYKCRDRNCDGVIWPPKHGEHRAQPAPATRAPSPAQQNYYDNSNGALPGEYNGDPYAPYGGLNAVDMQPPKPNPAAQMLALHYECFKHAYTRLKKANEGNDPALIFTGSDVLAYTAQLFIEANKKGIASLAA